MYYVYKMYCKYLIYEIYVCMYVKCRMFLKYFIKISDIIWKGEV